MQIVTSQCPSLYNLKCCQNVRLQKPNRQTWALSKWPQENYYKWSLINIKFQNSDLVLIKHHHNYREYEHLGEMLLLLSRTNERVLCSSRKPRAIYVVPICRARPTPGVLIACQAVVATNTLAHFFEETMQTKEAAYHGQPSEAWGRITKGPVTPN